MLRLGSVIWVLMVLLGGITVQSVPVLAEGCQDTELIPEDTGRCLLQQERYLDALDYLEATARGPLSLSYLGLAHYQLGNFADAEEALRQSIAGWEALRSEEAPLAQITLFEQQAHTYELLQRVLVAQGQFVSALEIAEYSRGRTLAQQLGQTGTTPTYRDIRRIAKQQNTAFVIYSVLGNARDFLDNALGDDTGTEATLLIWVVSPQGDLTFKSLVLNNDILPSVGGADSPIESLIQLSRTSLGVGNRGFGDLDWTARRPQIASDIDLEFLQQLHEWLITPIASELPSNPNIVVTFVPQGALYLVPFAALPDAMGTYLIERHTIAIAPSIQTLKLTQQPQPFTLDGEALIVGNPITMPTLPNGETLPPLPGAEQEALAISELLQTDAYIGPEATETTIRQQLTQPHILHFATHGLLDADPILNDFGLPLTAEIPTSEETGVYVTPGAIVISGNVTISGIPAEIALAHQRVVKVPQPGLLAFAPSPSDDGWLSAADIAQLDLQAQLVVLSACNTGRGRITGDGVVGLGRAFLVAGVPSVILSLWQVPDQPTADLMTEFYRQLQQHLHRAHALRQAMLAVKANHPHPKNWAGFTLLGQAQ